MTPKYLRFILTSFDAILMLHVLFYFWYNTAVKKFLLISYIFFKIFEIKEIN